MSESLVNEENTTCECFAHISKHITTTSKDIPGLKYLGVLLKRMVNGDVTIWMPLNSASTISLPVEANIHIYII